MNMKKLVALLLALVMVFALCACGPKDNQDTGKKDDGKKTAMKADDIPDEMTSSDGKYQVAFVTDVGELKDKSFNQGTYDGVKLLRRRQRPVLQVLSARQRRSRPLMTTVTTP